MFWDLFIYLFIYLFIFWHDSCDDFDVLCYWFAAAITLNQYSKRILWFNKKKILNKFDKYLTVECTLLEENIINGRKWW